MSEIIDGRKDALNEFKLQLINRGYENADSITELAYIILSKYEVIVRSTELMVTDRSDTNKIIEKYKVAKIISGYTEATINQYMYQVNTFFNFVDKPITDVNSDDIRYYLAIKKVGQNGSKPVSQRTLHNIRTYLDAFFNWAVENKFIQENPVSEVDKIKKNKELHPAFTKLDIDAILNVCKKPRDKALIWLLYKTGIRAIEVGRIRECDINFANKSILIHGKGNKERIVYMDDVTIKYLRLYIKSQKHQGEFIFMTKMKTPMNTRNVEEQIRSIGVRAEVSNCTPHRFRRTFATECFNSGMPIFSLAKLMGHESIQTTQGYIDASNTEQFKNDYNRYVA